MFSNEELVSNYCNSRIGKKYPASHPYINTYDKRLYANWILGQNYRSQHGYHGEYPPNYLDRIMGFFGVMIQDQDILHVCSGSLDSNTIIGDTLDIHSEIELKNNLIVRPKIVANAENMSEIIGKNKYWICLVDVPYSNEDAEHYGVALLNRNKVLKQCEIVLKESGLVFWLDQVLPMFCRKKQSLIYANMTFEGYISIVRSTNHRGRFTFIFRKRKTEV